MPLPPTNLQNSAHYRTHYAAIVAQGDGIDVITKPEYWIHVSRQLKRMDVIDVLPEDESYYAELLVLSVGVGYAKVMVLREIQLNTVEDGDSDITEVKYGGIHNRWTVVRKSDHAVLQTGIKDKAEAVAAAANYERVVA